MTSVERYAITNGLESLEQARVLLEIAGSPQEAKRVADFGEAMRYVAQQAGLGLEAQNEAAEIRLRAMRKVGDMLATGDLNKGGRPSKPLTGSQGFPPLAELFDMPTTSAAEKYSSRCQALDRIAEEVFEQKIAEIRAARGELTLAGLLRSVHFSSDSAEWYTPPHIVERVVEVLGAIDLDPCADSERSIPATEHFTKEDNALFREWRGRVYMNPPYGDEIRDWVRKLVVEFEEGAVEDSIALVPARTDTEWFSLLREYPRLFIRGRLRFSGHENSAPFPSAVFYLGANKEAFLEVFSDLGDIFEVVAVHD